MDPKLKHLEFIQAVITRMATNSFLFKGWAITLAAALAGFAAADSKRGLLIIALVSTLMFWALDAYYLWLERCFIVLYRGAAQMVRDVVASAPRSVLQLDHRYRYCRNLRHKGEVKWPDGCSSASNIEMTSRGPWWSVKVR
jgi:hypothetical protein